MAECMRVALPRLRDAGLPMDESPWAPDLEPENSMEGMGMLVLDWLVEQGVTVFLKADGERPIPGWTFIAKGGPLTEFLRTDGAHAENCFTPMLDNLRHQDLPVPV
ncbi:hypothetical protein ACFY97_20825 [Streptomyces klenkii]|uniref:hypothetical protein n=1 Tax=Streptomyces klenkii TaxID=1420899 RepID=UPI0011C43F79|nr:hypothetical protein [Streptomyces klenkii]